METGDARVSEQVASVAASLEPRIAELASDIRDLIQRDIPTLDSDPTLTSLLGASVEENVVTVVHMLQHGIVTAHVEAPTAALEYARRLAQRDIPATALIRAYRVGQARFLRHCIGELLDQTPGEHVEGASTQWMVEHVSDTLDRVVEQVIAAYESARERWVRNRSAVLTMRLRSVLAGENVDLTAAQTALGYRLLQRHLGVVLWADSTADHDPLKHLGGVACALAVVAGSPQDPLFVPCDETSAWAWLAITPAAVLRCDEAQAVLAEHEPAASIALGEPASGVDGFRRTHLQALRAQSVALAAGPHHAPVTYFIDVAPVAMMCSDIESAREWVKETLGALAIDSERNARLRETARVFLQTGGSYTSTANQLFLHRNTAQYRVQKAEELRGRPLREGRLDVELALLACHWLGSTVLQDGSATIAGPCRPGMDRSHGTT
ncbi:MAG: helix-turn-helix domain-containing protein [Pseudonocardiales bacterium]|nr:helix-turn-helix domain-containing protein [Pseudonocardiales bacterium]